MAKAAVKRGKNKDNARRSKKKTSILTQERVEYVDYKDTNLLRRFMSDRAKIRARRVTGNDSQQQKEIARAIKNAREMALLPYANRVTTQRGGGRGRDRDGDDRRDRPPRREENDETSVLELPDAIIIDEVDDDVDVEVEVEVEEAAE
jgi:small subunit ribosomal protein S18